MPIRFQCDCGQAITARDEFAGKKVQCSACRKVLPVPGQRKDAAATRAPAAAAPTMIPPTRPTSPRVDEGVPSDAIRFRCGCGAEYHAKPQFAGEPSRCPRCSEILFIPTGPGARASRSRPAPTSRFREPGSSLVTFVLVLLVLAVAGGSGWAYWEYYGKDAPKPAARHRPTTMQPGLMPPGSDPNNAPMGAMGGRPGQMGGRPGQMGGRPGQMGGFPGQMGGFPGRMGGFPGQMGGRPGSE